MLKILATDGMDKSGIAKLEQKGCEVCTSFYEPAALCEVIGEYDVIIVRSATKLRAAQIDAAAAGKTKLLLRGGVGMDNIDAEYAEGKGLTVKNTPKASSDAVAELALAHIFSVARFISVAGHTMREGKWEKNAYKGIELQGKTVGIVGYGRIGQALGRRCQALGMKVLAQDIYQVKSLENENMRYVELPELLANADIISLHVPSLPGQPIINEETIAQMKQGAILINTSRGTNIDEEALLRALDSGRLYGAGLDVFAEEPSKNPALYSHPRVSCTPHVGASTSEAQKRIGAELVDIISEYYGI